MGADWVLMERGVEVGVLASAVAEVARGNGGAVLVEGPAGVGKSRLVSETQAMATEAGALVLSARGLVLERDFPFGVVRQLFESLLARAGAAEEQALWAGPASQARGIFQQIDPGADSTGDFAVMHALFWLTLNACHERPLVLTVDDVHWCDVPSLRFLCFLLLRVPDVNVLVVMGLRTGEPAADEALVQLVVGSEAVRVLRPRLLSAQAVDVLLRQAFPRQKVEAAFVTACHQATRGNPLLVRELARLLAAESLAPTAVNAPRSEAIGSRAVGRLVKLQLRRLPASCGAAARALAILGGRADLSTIAALSPSDLAVTVQACGLLERAGIVRADQPGGLQMEFAHPLMQAAVYDSLALAERVTFHQRAAQWLVDTGAEPERVAAHLLRLPAVNDRQTIEVLRAAAVAAAARGTPDSAHTYLRRCLLESLPDEERLDVLIEAGRAALLVDTPAAADHYGQAHSTLLAWPDTNAVRQAEIAVEYASTLLYTGRIDECKGVITQAIDRRPIHEQDLRRRLQAWLVIIAFNFPGHDEIRPGVADLRQLPPDSSMGGRMLECALAIQQAYACDRAAVPRARRGLSEGPMFEIVGNFTNCAWWTLIHAEADDIIELINTFSDQMHQRGDLATLGAIHHMRGTVWLQRGQLGESHADLQEGLRLLDMSGTTTAMAVVVPPVAESLMEQGRLQEAAAVLDKYDPVARSGPYMLAARAQLLFLQGEYDGALQVALTSKARGEEVGLLNPAMLSWRTWAALSLHALNRPEQAQAIVAEDLRLSRKWGAQRSLGRALRTAGLVAGDEHGLHLLQQAVELLTDSPARLEYAKALAGYGTALHHHGARAQARETLRQAFEIATRCGAAPLAERSHAELTAAGGRLRHTMPTGPQALTPSEHRIAELAATGLTNREIAQRLYITPKTVEIHLSAAYRKLAIGRRAQLAKALFS